MLLATPPCTLHAGFVLTATCCTASRTHATLSQHPKAKASSRPVFAVAPGPQHRARIRRAGWKSVLQRVKTSTAETGDDDVLTDADLAIVGIHALRTACASCMRPCLSSLPRPGQLPGERPPGLLYPQPLPWPRVCNHKRSVPSPRLCTEIGAPGVNLADHPASCLRFSSCEAPIA